MFCSNCGHNLGDGYAFCPNCGAKVMHMAPPPAPTPVPAPVDAPEAPEAPAPAPAPETESVAPIAPAPAVPETENTVPSPAEPAPEASEASVPEPVHEPEEDIDRTKVFRYALGDYAYAQCRSVTDKGYLFRCIDNASGFFWPNSYVENAKPAVEIHQGDRVWVQLVEVMNASQHQYKARMVPDPNIYRELRGFAERHKEGDLIFAPVKEIRTARSWSASAPSPSPSGSIPRS